MFWISLVSSLLFAVALVLCAPGIAWFFREGRLTSLTAAFAVLIVLGGATSSQLALISREFQFKTLAAIDVLTATVGAAAGVTAAWLTESYWSLFISSLAPAVVGFGSVWLLSGFRPGWPDFEGDFREIIRFGSGLTGVNLFNFVSRNADNVLIGRFWGSEQLGYYDRAYRLILFPLTLVLAPLSRVMVPILSRLTTDADRYRKAYLESQTLLLFATQPGLVTAIVFAEQVFNIVLGPNWVPAAHIFQWLGIAGLYHLAASPTGWLFLSQGRARDFFWLALYNCTTIVVAIGVGLPWGAMGVAICYTVSEYLFRAPLTFVFAGRRGHVSTRDLFLFFLPHCIATVLSILVLLAVRIVSPSPGAIECLALLLLSYAVYGLALITFPSKRQILLTTRHTIYKFVMP